MRVHSSKENEFYHSREWRAVRQTVLERDCYLCQECRRNGIVKQGNTVHHKIHLRDDWSKRLDMNNLETICQQCHNREHFEKGYSNSKRKRIKKEKSAGVLIFKRNKDLV
ncbi:MAG: HNH endonuclease signature motif containing protein [Liquorilactobacillus ghanensis]|uniref:HNH endonuclease n=1 Tax=Liquorilactobacillus ghanensis TaxID=399370 RepID=UPI0039E8B521